MTTASKEKLHVDQAAFATATHQSGDGSVERSETHLHTGKFEGFSSSILKLYSDWEHEANVCNCNTNSNTYRGDVKELFRQKKIALQLATQTLLGDTDPIV